jgi:hypothetical protein
MDTIGDADNAVIEAFCGRMQTELLDPRRWTTRGAGQRVGGGWKLTPYRPAKGSVFGRR